MTYLHATVTRGAGAGPGPQVSQPNIGQASNGSVPSAMLTPVSNSSTLTRPSPLQSPMHMVGPNGVGVGVASTKVEVLVDVLVGAGGVEVGTSVLVGLVKVVVGVGVSAGVAVAVSVGVAVGISCRFIASGFPP